MAHVRVAKVYPFHMVLSYSRDPFCCFTTSMDIGTFFACHRRAFAHFGGVPGAIVYDRTKSVVRQHVGPWGCGAAASGGRGFVGHYNFDIDVLAAPPAGRHGQPAGLWRATQRRPHRDQHLPGR